jgi:hypothetical protein
MKCRECIENEERRVEKEKEQEREGNERKDKLRGQVEREQLSRVMGNMKVNQTERRIIDLNNM